MRIILLQTVGGVRADGDTGGGVVQLANIGREWCRSGNQVFLITNSDDAGGKMYQGLTKVHRVRSFTGLFVIDFFMNFLRQKPDLVKAITSILEDNTSQSLIISASPFPSDVIATFYLSWRFKLRAIVNFHHLPPPPWKHPIKRGVIRSVVNFVTNQFSLLLVKMGQMLPSIEHPSEITSSGWRIATGILKNEIPLSRQFDARQASLKRGQEGCFIGRVAPNKGVTDLIRSWKIVSNVFPEAKVVIAGRLHGENYGRRLYRLRSKLRLEHNVLFEFRHISEMEKMALLSSSLLFVFPSYEEGWSLSVMEAAFFGAVPVTYDLIAYEYLGREATKVPVGDFVALAHTIIELLSNTDKVIAMSNIFSRKVTEFNLPEIAQYQLSKIMQFTEIGHI